MKNEELRKKQIELFSSVLNKNKITKKQKLEKLIKIYCNWLYKT